MALRSNQLSAGTWLGLHPSKTKDERQSCLVSDSRGKSGRGLLCFLSLILGLSSRTWTCRLPLDNKKSIQLKARVSFQTRSQQAGRLAGRLAHQEVPASGWVVSGWLVSLRTMQKYKQILWLLVGYCWLCQWNNKRRISNHKLLLYAINEQQYCSYRKKVWKIGLKIIRKYFKNKVSKRLALETQNTLRDRALILKVLKEIIFYKVYVFKLSLNSSLFSFIINFKILFKKILNKNIKIKKKYLK